MAGHRGHRRRGGYVMLGALALWALACADGVEGGTDDASTGTGDPCPVESRCGGFCLSPLGACCDGVPCPAPVPGTDTNTTLPPPPDPDSSSGELDTSTGTTGEPMEVDWPGFLDDREAHLEALAAPILACSANVDTGHPAFHGCYDWHSHVHAIYALHVLYRRLGDERYLEAANETLVPADVDAELANVMSGSLNFERPYGFSWFLQLTIERELATGLLDLRPMADAVASGLWAYVQGLSPAQMEGDVLEDDHDNLSWAIINLARWSAYVGDPGLSADVQELASGLLLDPGFDASCPLTQEQIDTDDFFPPCLLRVMAAIVALPPEQVEPWLPGVVPPQLVLDPLLPEMIFTAHRGGLNFSRAWGLYQIHRAAEEPVGAMPHYRDLFVRHVEEGMAHPEIWTEDYAYSHWIAQFGVYAISYTYEDVLGASAGAGADRVR